MKGSTQNNIVVSIVTYAPDISLLAKTLDSLVAALRFSKGRNQYQKVNIYLIDNGPGDKWCLGMQSLVDQLGCTEGYIDFSIISGQGNIGFGCGHNLVINQIFSNFHLILNPDVILDLHAISECFDFMDLHPAIICISPFSEETLGGEQQFLCKRYPALLDFALRGFAPEFVKRLFVKRLARYEMCDDCGSDPVLDIPIISGCFMFFRSAELKKLGGFSPKYFLYFEDFDLSLRANKIGQLAYAPKVKITHFGGHTAHKGRNHILMFLRSALIFYRDNGLRIW